jgi:hypothetical protein
MMPAGRPTKYEDRFCDMVEEAMGSGLSLGAFAGQIGVARSTINEWIDNHPAFSEAVSRAKGKRLLHWEQAAIRVAEKGGGPGTATIIVFGLKNMGGEEWADVQRQELTGKDGAPIQSETRHAMDVSGLTEDQLRAIASIKLPADA